MNLVSRGFKHDFLNRYPWANLRFFTNGIDEGFLQKYRINSYKKDEKQITVVYAGNIGTGQGIEKILPNLAKKFEKKLKFKIIGDGGKKSLLIKNLQKIEVENVELLPPVKRSELINYYQSADILFLHLNENKCFKKVIPSKIFEYAASGKPIWAGVSGYPKEFMENNIENCVTFAPCATEEAVESFKRLSLGLSKRQKFIEKFSRKKIMSEMARDMINVILQNLNEIKKLVINRKFNCSKIWN